MRRVISEQAVKHAIPDRLTLLRFARQGIAEKLDDLTPGARHHWVFSRTAPQCFDLLGLSSLDDSEALRLATKARATRRQWAGYRTDLDYWADVR